MEAEEWWKQLASNVNTNKTNHIHPDSEQPHPPPAAPPNETTAAPPPPPPPPAPIETPSPDKSKKQLKREAARERKQSVKKPRLDQEEAGAESARQDPVDEEK